MAAQKPFRPSDTEEAFPELVEGDFMLPFCVPGAEILMGEDLAVIVVPTQERQRVGIPMDLQSVSDLYACSAKRFACCKRQRVDRCSKPRRIPACEI
ncbi:hypothetical protein DHODJN_18275 [Methylorubrum extorquens]